MPFDPTWPPTDADAESIRMREQFNALNDRSTALQALIDDQAALIADIQAQLNALKPRVAIGFGDSRACGVLTLMGMLQGKPSRMKPRVAATISAPPRT